MTLFFGIVAILQNLFLPGILIKEIFFKKFKFIQFLPFIFGISTIFSWLSVYLFTKLGIYNFNNYIFLIILELISIIFLIKFKKQNNYFNFEDKQISLLNVINNVFVFITFARFFLKIGNVYTAYDAIVSFHGRWATQWFENTIPSNAMLYPQLLPANMSISNILTASSTEDMQLFSYAACLAFVPLTSLVAGTLASFIRDQRIYIANILFLLFIGFPFFQGVIDQTGYVDIPSTCFSILTIGLFLLGWFLSKRDTKYGLRLILLSSFMAAGAAATKQSGFFIAFLNFPAIIFWSQKFKFPISKTILKVFLIHILVYGLWYFEVTKQILDGTNITAIMHVQEEVFSQTNGYLIRIFNALRNFPHFFLMVFISLFALSIPKYKISTLIIIPAFIIWIFFFSYTYRNFYPTLPFISISWAAVIANRFNYKYLKLTKPIKINPIKKIGFKEIKTKQFIYVLSTLLIFSVVISPFVDKSLYLRNEYKRRFIMPIQYSEAIYKAYEQFGQGKILTSQKYYIARLPRVPDKVVVPFDFELDSVDNEKIFKRLVKESDAIFLLTSKNPYFKPSKNIENEINRLETENILSLITKEKDVKIYFISR